MGGGSCWLEPSLGDRVQEHPVPTKGISSLFDLYGPVGKSFPNVFLNVASFADGIEKTFQDSSGGSPYYLFR